MKTRPALNVISGNAGDGVTITASGNFVQGNFIGTDVTGTFAIANTRSGVSVSGSNNLIGETVAGARNIISGNAFDGIAISGSANAVQGNYIGTARGCNRSLLHQTLC